MLDQSYDLNYCVFYRVSISDLFQESVLLNPSFLKNLMLSFIDKVTTWK